MNQIMSKMTLLIFMVVIQPYFLLAEFATPIELTIGVCEKGMCVNRPAQKGDRTCIVNPGLGGERFCKSLLCSSSQTCSEKGNIMVICGQIDSKYRGKCPTSALTGRCLINVSDPDPQTGIIACVKSGTTPPDGYVLGGLCSLSDDIEQGNQCANFTYPKRCMSVNGTAICARGGPAGGAPCLTDQQCMKY